jgi:phospholipase/carboxylesterase
MSLRHDVIPGSGPRPASGISHLVVLHGLGDTRQGWRQALPAIRHPGVTAVLAEAPLPYPPESPFGFSWFDIHGMKEPDQAQVDAHRTLLVELIRGLGVPAHQVAVLGFSQGGLMTLDLALAGPFTLGRCVAISGWLGDPYRFPKAFGPAARTQRILATHGDADEVIPLFLAEDGIRVLAQHGIEVDWRVYDKAHNLDGEEALEIRAFLDGA